MTKATVLKLIKQVCRHIEASDRYDSAEKAIADKVLKEVLKDD